MQFLPIAYLYDKTIGQQEFFWKAKSDFSSWKLASPWNFAVSVPAYFQLIIACHGGFSFGKCYRQQYSNIATYNIAAGAKKSALSFDLPARDSNYK